MHGRRHAVARCIRRTFLAALAAAVVVGASASVATAHLIHTNGVWTFRYFTRIANAANDKTPCLSDDSHYWVDPLNIIFWAYGEWSRMRDHVDNDTPWGTSAIYGEQTICGDTDAYVGNYDIGHNENWDLGEPSCVTCDRYHIRLFAAPHSHSDDYSKWSTMDTHHEHWTGLGHTIDMNWEDAEYHLGYEMRVHHYWGYDYWIRRNGIVWRGWWDDGATTRVGGEHDGVYP